MLNFEKLTNFIIKGFFDFVKCIACLIIFYLMLYRLYVANPKAIVLPK